MLLFIYMILIIMWIYIFNGKALFLKIYLIGFEFYIIKMYSALYLFILNVILYYSIILNQRNKHKIYPTTLLFKLKVGFKKKNL